MSEKITVASALVKYLTELDADVIFGYPGAAICPFYDEIYKRRSILHILVRREDNAGHAASGYARISGKPGVCVCTSGPGALNLISAIGTAHMDSIPLIAITGQVNTKLIGSDAFQEADIIGATESFSKHSYLLTDPEKLSETIERAFYIAQSGRPGPVLIDIPFDIQKKLTTIRPLNKNPFIRSYNPPYDGIVRKRETLMMIKRAKKPLILVGGGVHLTRSYNSVCKFAEIISSPVIVTLMGLSAFPYNHPLYIGMVGMHGEKAANYAAANCDLLILLGARASDRTIPNPKGNNRKILHIDIDTSELGKNIPFCDNSDKRIVGDLRFVLEKLMSKNPSFPEHTEWLTSIKTQFKEKSIPESSDIIPKIFIEKLNSSIDQNSIICADVGQNQIWAANGIKKGRFLTSGGMGTMGYSLPAAIGASLADRSRTVIVICGDGSFQMQMCELATAVQEKLSIKIIVFINNRLGMVREFQTRDYEDRQIGVSLDGSPDFVLLAKSYGIESEYIEKSNDIKPAIKKMLESKGIYLLAVKVGEYEGTLF